MEQCKKQWGPETYIHVSYTYITVNMNILGKSLGLEFKAEHFHLQKHEYCRNERCGLKVLPDFTQIWSHAY